MTPHRIATLAITAGLVAPGCAEQDLQVANQCKELVTDVAAGPSGITAIGFSADAAAAATDFDGDAQLSYEGRIPDTTSPLTLRVTATGPGELIEVEADEGYDPDWPTCEPGTRFLQTRATVTWTLSGHVTEARTTTLRFHALDDVEEAFPTDDRDLAPVEPWLVDLVDDEVPCDDLPIHTVLARPGMLEARYRSVCDDGGHRAGTVFVATPMR